MGVLTKIKSWLFMKPRLQTIDILRDAVIANYGTADFHIVFYGVMSKEGLSREDALRKLFKMYGHTYIGVRSIRLNCADYRIIVRFIPEYYANY